MSETSDVETAPAVALRKPERFESVNDPAVRLVEDAYVEVMFVVDAFANVCVPVKVLLVYVFAIVVEPLMYVFTRASW